MNFQILLGRKQGRISMLIIIFMVFSIFIGLALYAAKVNVVKITIVVAIINIIATRFLYFLFKKKPVIYFQDDYLISINSILFRRKIHLSSIIKFQSRLYGIQGLLTVKHFKHNSVCETILGGDIYEYDLEKLPNILNNKLSKYNQKAKEEYAMLKDKTAAIGLFAFSSKTLLILAVSSYSLSIPINLFILERDFQTIYVGYIINISIIALVFLLYFKHIMPNRIFQYIIHFLVVYGMIFSVIYYSFSLLSQISI